MNPLYLIFKLAMGLSLLVGFPLLFMYWAVRSHQLMRDKPEVINARLDRDYRFFFHLFALR